MAPVDITQRGTFINASAAKSNLEEYFKDHGKAQPKHDDKDHVFGHVFGLAKIKELISKIDQHNLAETDESHRIHGVRIYRSKTGPTNDLLIVPVTKDSNDYPASVHESSKPPARAAASSAQAAAAPEGDDMILSGARPCPNQCSGND
jgi:hypothetical protein